SATLLSNSRRVYAPSQDVLSRLDSLVPGVNWRLRPHPEEYPEARSVAASRATDEPLRVAVIGAIGFHKGSRVLLDCANDAAKRDLPLQFHVIGYTDVDRELVTTGKVSIGGTYRDEELQEQLALAGCQIALLPSVWPETFCYTLSAALAGKLYPVAFDLGAIAERIRALGWGELLSIRTSAAELNDHLLDLEPPLFPTGSSWQNLETSYKSYLVDYYDSLEL
ncbi:MAG: glycosyltransferase, partial [Myxococcota bacterium]